VVAFAVDEALDMRLTVVELHAVKARKDRLPKGMRYATEAEYDDPLPDAPMHVPYPEEAAA